MENEIWNKTTYREQKHDHGKVRNDQKYKGDKHKWDEFKPMATRSSI